MSTPTTGVVKLDNVSYVSFPTASELMAYKANVIHSFLTFLRSIGVSNREQLTEKLRATPEQFDILCRKGHYMAFEDTDRPERQSTYAVDHRKEWQRKTLHGSEQNFEVDLKKILELAVKRSKFPEPDAIEKEVYFLFKRLIDTKVSCAKAQGKYTLDLKEVDRIANECKLKPQRSWERASLDYKRALLTEYFPNTPFSLLIEYLFTNDIGLTSQTMVAYCVKHKIPRTKSRTILHREEQAAFAKWAAGIEVDDFLTAQAERNRDWRPYAPNI